MNPISFLSTQKQPANVISVFRVSVRTVQVTLHKKNTTCVTSDIPKKVSRTPGFI